MGEKSNLDNHEFQTICATGYNDMIASLTIVKKVTFSGLHSAKKFSNYAILKHHIKIYIY